MEKVGKYAFVVGIAVAVIAGLTDAGWAPAALAVLGIIVGLLNISSQETQRFLLAAIALMLTATALDAIPAVGEAFAPFVANVVAFLGAAVFIVAILTLFEVSRD